jgi:L-xylulokinase
VRLTGGASRSPAWSQIFADALGRPVEVTTGRETGALGASMLAGIAVGAYRDLDEATARTVRIAAAYAPRATESAELDGLYARYESVLTALTPVWDGARAR